MCVPPHRQHNQVLSVSTIHVKRNSNSLTQSHSDETAELLSHAVQSSHAHALALRETVSGEHGLQLQQDAVSMRSPLRGFELRPQTRSKLKC